MNNLTQARRGKSQVFRASKRFCIWRGGKLVLETNRSGLRTEVYEMPDGRRICFIETKESMLC